MRYRYLIPMALVLLILHVGILATLGLYGSGPILSGVIQLALGVIATISAFGAARRSSSFGRSFWNLTSTAFALWCTGQIVATYFGNILHIYSLGVPVINMLFYGWPAPLVMCLFLDPGFQKHEIDWERILDFAQVVIAFVLLDLYLSDLPARGNDRGAFQVAALFDGLLALGFFARGRSSHRAEDRDLFLNFGAFRVVAFITDLAFVLDSPDARRGTMFDLVWAAPWLIPIATATMWSGTTAEPSEESAAWKRRRLQVTQILPLIVPVLVLFMALHVARQRLVIAWTALLVSLAISYSRLLVVDQERRIRFHEAQERTRDLNQVISSISDVVWSADVLETGTLRFLYYSPVIERLTGRPAEWFIGDAPQAWLSVIHPEDRELVSTALARLMSRESTSEETEFRIRYADGHTRWLRDSLRATFEHGHVRLHGIISDITERKRLEEQLHEAQKMDAIGRLAGGIAHDFNNLITIITGYSALLLDEASNSPSIREKVEQISKAGDQAASLTRQLLAFSRRQVLQPKVLNLNDVLDDMGKMLRRVVSEDIDLEIHSDPRLGLIRCDRGQIEQVILNLIINARDAVANGGRIDISTQNVEVTEADSRQQVGLAAGSYVRLRVEDSGCGMTEETKAHIFEPFFTTKERGKGTGLGLATVYGIVNRAEGRITVDSEAGKGTTFDVYLPRTSGDLETDVIEALEAPRRASTETILVVEDQDGIRRLMSEILGQNGYSVLLAQNGREALTMLQRGRTEVDLIITDLVMPQMGGRELATAVSAIYPETKILYMSGHDQDIETLISSGQSFIDKPFAPEALLRKVRDILSMS